MPSVRGRSGLKRFMAELPGELERKVLRGAGRVAANVVAAEARERSISAAVAAAVKVKVSAADGRILAKVQVKGPGAYIAPWIEWGTSAHFISVDESQRQGMSVGKINEAHKKGSLVIGGNFVGATVLHPGARPHPFLRPALDMKGDAAIAAAQSYINSRVRRTGIVGAAETGESGG